MNLYFFHPSITLIADRMQVMLLCLTLGNMTNNKIV